MILKPDLIRFNHIKSIFYYGIKSRRSCDVIIPMIFPFSEIRMHFEIAIKCFSGFAGWFVDIIGGSGSSILDSLVVLSNFLEPSRCVIPSSVIIPSHVFPLKIGI